MTDNEDASDEEVHLSDQDEPATKVGAPEENESPVVKKVKKKVEPGVIFISFLPENMTPLHLKQIFEKYGEVGRIFLQPEEFQARKVKPRYNKGSFSEGWIEMIDKRLAKRLALTLNNTLITDGKKSKWKDHTWSVKYLHRFRWDHLTERLAYEREVKRKRMRVEYARSKKETAAFQANVESNKRIQNIKQRREKRGEKTEIRAKKYQYKQRKTVDELRKEKLAALNNDSTANSSPASVKETVNTNPKSVLSKIFS